MKWLDLKVPNPWISVTCSIFFAASDEKFIVTVGKKNGGVEMEFGSQQYKNEIIKQYPKAGLTFDCLPEPYSGNPDANVYCLNMNPGAPDPCFDKPPLTNDLYVQRALNNLKHAVSSAFWRESLVKSKGVVTDNITLFESLINIKSAPTFSIHEGAKWQRQITKELRKEKGGTNPNIFFLEYFPYHSSSGFDFPEFLPSYNYRNSLLEFAMNEDKLIIIMRHESKWYNIKDRYIGYRLKRYKKKVILKDKQGAWLTRNNMVLPIPDCRCDSLSWKDIINMM